MAKKKTKKKAAKKRVVKPKLEPKESYHDEPKSEYELTEALSEELRDAWKKLRTFAADIGEQRIYTSAKAMMFARATCYMFIRPKKSYLELVFFLADEQSSPMIFRAERRGTRKVAHTIRVTHEDHIEEPLTDWIQEAYVQAE